MIDHVLGGIAPQNRQRPGSDTAGQRRHAAGFEEALDSRVELVQEDARLGYKDPGLRCNASGLDENALIEGLQDVMYLGTQVPELRSDCAVLSTIFYDMAERLERWPR